MMTHGKASSRLQHMVVAVQSLTRGCHSRAVAPRLGASFNTTATRFDLKVGFSGAHADMERMSPHPESPTSAACI